MAENMFEKFNEMFDIEGLQKDIENAASNTGDFIEVPHGDYEVKVSKIEMGETSVNSKTPSAPMAKVWFTVIAGEFKNQKIFMNQPLTSGFGIHKMNQFLDSLESGVAVTFENFGQYADAFKKVFDAIDGVGEYQLAYTPNKKNANFSEYDIIKRFK